MKKAVATLLVFLVSVLALTSAIAQEIVTEYDRVPQEHTHEYILDVDVSTPNEGAEEYQIHIIEPTELSLKTLLEIQEYVKNISPVPFYYFPEDVRTEIEALLPDDVNGASLYMTEFAALLPAEWSEAMPLTKEIKLDVNYHLGQVVVSLVGYADDENTVHWHALKTVVKDTGILEVSIPEELHAVIRGNEIMLCVMTPQPGVRGGTDNGTVDEDEQIPSKTAHDLVQINELIAAEEIELSEEFRVFPVPETLQITELLTMIRAHAGEVPLFHFFETDVQEQVISQLPEGFDCDTLVAYEVLALMSEGYHMSYGDVSASFTFPTMYQDGQEVVALIGIPVKDHTTGDQLMQWTALKTIVADGCLDVLFTEDLLVEIETEAALMIVLSAPLENIRQ
ncbi:MAG: hypothetical protein IJ418_09930 [Clostridia bacterium]|nr:hypothetical protein [Clostridia bacterium]